MPSKTATKDHAPQAAPSAPAAAPPTQPKREPGVYSLLCHTMDYASDSEKEFLRDFLNQCAEGTYTVQELALWKSTTHYGFGITSDMAERMSDGERANIGTILDILLLESSDWWLGSLLRQIANYYKEYGRQISPDHVYLMMENEMSELNSAMRTTKNILHAHPDLVADEIQKAVEALQEVKCGWRKRLSHSFTP